MSEKITKGVKRDKLQSTPNKKSKKSESGTNQLRNRIVYEHDAAYRFVEPDLKKAEGPLQYTPVYFLRAHSKNNDSADVQTQIWQCAFEPDPENLKNSTEIVATCGGTSVCFIHVDSGEVVLKYNRNAKISSSENLYALAWSSLPLDDVGLKRINILAAGGGRSMVVLIHPEVGCLYQMFRTVPNKAAAVINSLLFHPKKASWLFCGHEDGHIQLWDVGIPALPLYSNVTPVHLITIPATGGDIYNLAFSQTHDLLISGCDHGLFAWKIDVDKIEKNHRLDRTQFLLPDVNNVGTVVDSICLIRDDILAVKCAIHGFIYIFKLSDHLRKVKSNSELHQSEVELKNENFLRVKWSDTDNYYMNMGIDRKSCTLVCGDDKGKLWVYDLYSYINGDIPSPLTGSNAGVTVEASTVLEWPELEDHEVEKARKLRVDTYDIVVDKCTVSDNASHIVAVTSNNMVCIWKRGLDSSQKWPYDSEGSG